MRCDPRRTKCVIADCVPIPAASARRRSIAYVFACGNCVGAELHGAARDCPKQRPLSVSGDLGALKIDMQPCLERVVTLYAGRMHLQQRTTADR